MRVTAARTAALVALAFGAWACGSGDITAGVSDSTFVATIAELRRIQNDASLDSARRVQTRQAVLQRRGLTPDRLEQAARALAGDPERAVAVWQAIDRRATGPAPAITP
jgi:hypothetical protein